MEQQNFFDENGVFTETEHYLLRRIQPEEMPHYQALAAIDTPDFLRNHSVSAAHAWEGLWDTDHLTCSILMKDDHTFCGFCQLQWIDSPTPEMGIDLLPAFQKQGIAPEVLPAFLAQAKKILPIDFFYAKVRKNNPAAQMLAEKIGGVCIGTKSLLPAALPAEMLAFAEQEFPALVYLEYHFQM